MISDAESLKLAAELTAEIARAIESHDGRAVKTSLRDATHWGELNWAAVQAVLSMAEYYEDAVASRLADSFAELALAVANCYAVTPDFYELSEWLWRRIDTALTEEEAR